VLGKLINHRIAALPSWSISGALNGWLDVEKSFFLTSHSSSSIRYYSIHSTTLVMCAGTVSSNVVNRVESADSVSLRRVETPRRNRIYSDPIWRRLAWARRMLAADVPSPTPGKGRGCEIQGQRPFKWSLIGDCCGHVRARAGKFWWRHSSVAGHASPGS